MYSICFEITYHAVTVIFLFADIKFQQGVGQQAAMNVSLVQMLAECSVSPNVVGMPAFQQFVTNVQACP